MRPAQNLIRADLAIGRQVFSVGAAAAAIRSSAIALPGWYEYSKNPACLAMLLWTFKMRTISSRLTDPQAWPAGFTRLRPNLPLCGGQEQVWRNLQNLIGRHLSGSQLFLQVLPTLVEYCFKKLIKGLMEPFVGWYDS